MNLLRNGFAIRSAANTAKPTAGLFRIGLIDDALACERLASLRALFPQVEFSHLDQDRVGADHDLQAMILKIAAGRPTEVDGAMRLLKLVVGRCAVAVVLEDADVGVMRRLVAAGAADVLPAPVGEPALVLCLERLLVSEHPHGALPRPAGQLVTLLKAGGGVGATTVAVQLGAMLARRAEADDKVCLVDFDIQFGAAALYLDMPKALGVTDILAAAGLEHAAFAASLESHASGLRLLAAPKDLTPLEMLNSGLVDAMLKGLRRQMAATLIDLPGVWTAWTDRALHLADRIVLVTALSVPHLQQARRQLKALDAQQLGDKPLTLVCNRCTPEQRSSLPIKAAERALGRDFDVVIPEDRKLLAEAANQGLELSAVKRGTKVEKAIESLARIMTLPVGPSAQRRN